MEKELAKDCNPVKSGEEITELVFILDKSGSMAGMEKDTFLENLKWYHSAMILEYLGYPQEAEVFYNKLAKQTRFSSLSVLVSGKKFFQKQKTNY